MPRDTGPAPKRFMFGNPSTAGDTSGFASLFDDIGEPGSERQNTASIQPRGEDEISVFMHGHLIEGLLNIGSNRLRIKEALDIFGPAFDVNQVAVISALQHKENNSAPRAAALDDPEYLALRYYLSPTYYRPINQYLRQGEPSDAMAQVTSLIRAALAKLDSPSSCKSFRAVKTRHMPAQNSFIEPALLSASERVEKAHTFMRSVYGIDNGPDKSLIVIFGLSARRVGSGIDEGPDGLSEVIYPPDCEFNVLLRGVNHKKAGTHMLVMEEQSQGIAGTVERQIEALALESVRVNRASAARCPF